MKQKTAKDSEQEKVRIHELYALILKVSPNPIIGINPDTSIDYVNPALTQLTGFSSEELVGKQAPYPFWSEKQKTVIQADLKTAMKKGSRSLEEHFQKKNGDLFWVEITSIPVTDNGELQYYIANWVDITERKYAEEKVLDSERFISDVFDSIQDGISVLDETLTIVRPNRWIENKYSDQMPLIGKKCYQAYQKKDSICPWCPSEKALQDGETHIEIVPYPDEHNPTGWIELSAYPVKDKTGKVTGVLEHVKDISDRLQAESDLLTLATREALLADIVQTASVAVAIGYPDGRLGFQNQAFRELTGFSEDELKTTSWNAKLTPPEWNEIETEKLKELHRTKSPVRYEKEYIRKDGTRVPIELIVHLKCDEQGEVDHYRAFITDITERKKFEATLRERTKELVCLNSISRDMQNFLSKDEMYRHIMDHIKENMQFPANTVPVIEIEGDKYSIDSSSDYLSNGLHADICLKNRKTGKLSVYYTEGKSFLLPEEQNLVNGVADMLSLWLEREHSESELHRSQERLSQFMASSTDGFLLLDSELNFVICNDAALNIVGMEKEGVIGRNLQDIVPDIKESGRYALYKSVIKDGKPLKLIDLIPNAKSGAIHLNVSAFKVGPGLGLTFSDITERIKSEERINLLYNDLEIKKKELEQVLYTTTHDLRSPLVNIQGFNKELELSLKELATVLKSDDVPESVREKCVKIIEEDVPESMKYIVSGTAKMDDLLAGLLTISRIGRQEMIIERLNMNALLEDVISEFEFEIRANNVKVDLGKLPAFTGDRFQINRVFSNLLGNALKFLDPSRPGAIKISGRKESDRVLYFIEDNGIGIPAHLAQRIFDIFHRLDHNKAGKGLGLTIVKQILDRNDGKITVDSTPGEGTRFSISLPVKNKRKMSYDATT